MKDSPFEGMTKGVDIRNFTPKEASDQDKVTLTVAIKLAEHLLKQLAENVDLADDPEQDVPALLLTGKIDLVDQRLDGETMLGRIEDDEDKRAMIKDMRAKCAQDNPHVALLALPAYFRNVPHDQAANWRDFPRIESIYIHAETATGACANASIIVSRDDGKYRLSPCTEPTFLAVEVESMLVDFYDTCKAGNRVH